MINLNNSNSKLTKIKSKKVPNLGVQVMKMKEALGVKSQINNR